MSGLNLYDRALGAYLGLAVGDALGATVEFMTPAEIRVERRVHADVVGGGWLRLRPGQVTDDTQMALALGGALVESEGWNLRAVAESFAAWLRTHPVDIGHTCRRGIRRFLQNGSLCGVPSEDEAGNGAAMRNLPVVLATLGDPEALADWSVQQAHITHWHELSDRGTVALARITRSLLLGDGDRTGAGRLAGELVAAYPVFSYDPWPGRTSGYIVDTVQTVLESFFATHSFEECLVRVVNRGGDADTTGALAGQLAGALYGVQGIPRRWLERLDPAIQARIRVQTFQLLELSCGVAGEQAGQELPGPSARPAPRLWLPRSIRRVAGSPCP